MNNNLQNGKTINSFLANPKSIYREEELIKLDLFINERQKNKESIHLLKYWGLSNKNSIDIYDFKALMMLLGLIKAIEKKYNLSINLTLIFTDTHALLNGYFDTFYNNYIKEIRDILNSLNYTHLLMSDIINQYLKINNYNDINEFLINLVINTKLLNKEAIVKFIGQNGFMKSASKYSIRYKENENYNKLGFDIAEQAAYAYIKLNQIERDYVKKKFPKSLFLTYTSQREKELTSPDLPSLQIYSYQRGIRSRPWFSHKKNNNYGI